MKNWKLNDLELYTLSLVGYEKKPFEKIESKIKSYFKNSENIQKDLLKSMEKMIKKGYLKNWKKEVSLTKLGKSYVGSVIFNNTKVSDLDDKEYKHYMKCLKSVVVFSNNISESKKPKTQKYTAKTPASKKTETQKNATKVIDPEALEKERQILEEMFGPSYGAIDKRKETLELIRNGSNKRLDINVVEKLENMNMVVIRGGIPEITGAGERFLRDEVV